MQSVDAARPARDSMWQHWVFYGRPASPTVSFTNDRPTLYFGAGARAQKAKHTARSDKISAAIDLAYPTWDEIKSLSLASRAHRVLGFVVDHLWRRFGEAASQRVQTS